MYIQEKVYYQIKKTIGCLDPESGGIIAENQDGVISDFYFDFQAGFGKTSYVPSRITLQNFIRRNWESDRLRFCGIVHSHPLCNTCVPSHIDIEMALKIMTENNMEKIYLLMVKGHEMKLYCIMKGNSQNHHSFREEEIEI